jgi:hypothetical protein
MDYKMKTRLARVLNFILWIPKIWCYYNIAVNLGALNDLSMEASMAGKLIRSTNSLPPLNGDDIFNFGIITLVNSAKFIFFLLIIYEFQRYYRAKLIPAKPLYPVLP